MIARRRLTFSLLLLRIGEVTAREKETKPRSVRVDASS
jgi:hypothetical protein